MQKEPLSKTKLAIIQLECPEFSASDLRILEDERETGKPTRKRAFWKIDPKGERVFDDIKNFSSHQTYYHYLFKLAERDGTVDRDTRLGVPSSALTDDDYDYWCKADYWHADEFIGLIIGRSPNQIGAYVRESGSATTELAEEILSLKMLLDRSYEMRMIDHLSSPSTLLTWAENKQIELPESLMAAAEKYGLLNCEDDGPVEGVRAGDKNVVQMPNTVPLTATEQPQNTKERDSMSKLIIGMAVRGYAYDPMQKRSSIATEISDDLAECGLSLDVDTTRKYLKRSADLLPRNYKPNSDKPKPNSRTA